MNPKRVRQLISILEGDGTDTNEDEIDEECARWDAMVRKAENEKEAEKALGCYTPSVYSDDGKNTISTVKCSINLMLWC